MYLHYKAALGSCSERFNLDQADYETKREAYLAVLVVQDNFVYEVQRQSIPDPCIVVDMTIYKDAAPYQAVNQNQDFIDANLTTGFLQNYPINTHGTIHNLIK